MEKNEGWMSPNNLILGPCPGSTQGHHSEPSATMARSATHQTGDGKSSLDHPAD